MINVTLYLGLGSLVYFEESKFAGDVLYSQVVLNFIPLLQKYKGFIACATGVDPDQLARTFPLFWIYTGHFLVRNKLMSIKVNSLDPDLCHLIRIYTVHFLVRNNQLQLTSNSLDPDQKAPMCWLYLLVIAIE
jgi:hypothetical protein